MEEYKEFEVPREELKKLKKLTLSEAESEKCSQVYEAFDKLKNTLSKFEAFQTAVMKVFKASKKDIVNLQVKDEIKTKVPFKVSAFKMGRTRPYLFMIDIDPEHTSIIDELRFDAFNRGPFKRP